MMKKILKYKWLLLLLVLVIGGSYYYYYQSKQVKETVPQQTATVTKGSIISVVASTGTISPVNSVDISSKITALIKEVKVKENERVEAGQVLVLLDAKELETQVNQARDKVANSSAKYKRVQYLHSIGAKSQEDLENALLEYQTSVSSFEGIQSKFNDTVIVSPISGVVIGKPLPAGTLVAQGVNNPTVIMTVADMSKKQIDTKVDETDIGKIQVGQKTTFTVDGYPNTIFHGKVANVSQKATTTQNVVYYSVTIDVEDPKNLLRPSMTARVNVIIGEKQGVATIPLSDLKTNNEGQFVTLLKEKGKLETVPVVVGLYGEDRVEIVSGVKEGDTLVISYNKAQEQKTNSPVGPPRIR